MSEDRVLEGYRARFRARDAERQAEEARADRLGNLRLGLALVALVLVVLPFVTREGTPWWGLIPIALAFLVLGRIHDRLSDRLRRARAAADYHHQEIERLEERWRSLPDVGADVAPSEADPESRARAQLAVDLDLFGPASVFQLLSRARTQHGRRTLAAWLTEPADAETVAARQVAVRALADAVELREALAVAAAGEDGAPLSDDRLLEWAEHGEPMPGGAVWRVVGLAQPLLLIASVVWWAVSGLAGPLVILALVHIGVLIATRRGVEARVRRLASPDRALLRYAALIETIESAPLEAPAVRALQDSLRTDGVSASDRVRELTRLVEMLDARLNAMFGLTIGPILLWDLNLVLRAERWQQRVGGHLRGWFHAIGAFEALASLGAHAWARPGDADAELVDAHGVFEAEGLAHPLIDRRRVVGNDVRLEGPGSVLLLSGSNMSGKSTFLRSIGLAWVLARAGAPAPARRLRIGSMGLVTSIRVTDSLARGASHFYAELERIKDAIDAAEAADGKMLYLLDEMLHGTNSKERYIGAAGVIRHLSARSALGVVTTHDLALAEVEALLPPGRLVNAHFGDEVEDGRIHFDYTLRPGPVRSTNAIRLMRAVGIDIDLALEARP